MKTTNLFKAVAFVAMVIVSIMNSEVKAQDRFITNEEVQNDLIVAKTIFRQSGTYLYNHMRYEFTYDDENRLTNKTASKWASISSAEKRMPRSQRNRSSSNRWFATKCSAKGSKITSS